MDLVVSPRMFSTVPSHFNYMGTQFQNCLYYARPTQSHKSLLPLVRNTSAIWRVRCFVRTSGPTQCAWPRVRETWKTSGDQVRFISADYVILASRAIFDPGYHSWIICSICAHTITRFMKHCVHASLYKPRPNFTYDLLCPGIVLVPLAYARTKHWI